MIAKNAADQETDLFALLSASASSEVRRFLGDVAKAAWGSPAPIETHISWVFLTPDRAYKLKKPVSLSFLDFSTLDAREKACRTEVAVNRLFAQELYLGLRPLLATSEGSIRFGPLLTDPSTPTPDISGSTILDWVVEMRRFDEGGEFDALAAQHALSPDTIRRLADKIAVSHLATQPAPQTTPWRGTLSQISEALSVAELGGDASEWRAMADAELRRVEQKLEARRRHGFFRRLHGDLHLGNVCLLDGEPTPFDAIEFNDAIATIDPLYDIAFTAMDLLWREEPALANALMNRYLGATRDYGGLVGWPLFLSLRAAIRAMTAATKGDHALAKSKLAFAKKLLAPRGPARLVAVAGLSGSGKSTLAASIAPGLAPLSGAVAISSDEVRKRLFGKTPETPLSSEAYAPEVSRTVYRRMLKDAHRALRAGATVILDGVFARPEEREAAFKLAKALDIDFAALWLETPLPVRLERVQARASAAIRSASDADEAVARAQTATLQDGEAGWSRLAAGQMSADATRAAAEEFLGLTRETAPRDN